MSSCQDTLFPSWETDAPSCALSRCGRYRYTLRIPLAVGYPKRCVFVMANPSTAIVLNGQFKSDRTVSKCMRYARGWGFTELIVENVRAWRETDPDKVPADPLAIGPENDERIRESADEADLVVCGRGELAGARGPVVLQIIHQTGAVPCALRTNISGSPAHPLYLPSQLRPVPLGTSR
jgi:hypothetical protein